MRFLQWKPGIVGEFSRSIRSRISSRLFVELVSLISAFAFITSCLGNAIIFWWNWKLSYFALATPTDVIMSSFQIFWFISVAIIQTLLVVAVILAAAVISPFAMRLGRSFWNWFGRQSDRRQIFLLSSLGVLMVATAAATSLLLPDEGLMNGDSPNRCKHAPLSNPYAPCIINPENPANGIKNPLADFRHTDYPLALTSGLYLADVDPLFSRCGRALVLWLGSSAALIRCNSELLIVKKVGDMVLRHEM